MTGTVLVGHKVITFHTPPPAGTHQVHFFLEVVHVLVPFAFLAFLGLAIGRGCQLVLIFPSLKVTHAHRQDRNLSTCAD